MGKSIIRVLIVDDSAMMRSILSRLISSDAGFEVAGTAADPIEASELIKTLKPDLMTLDIEMPRMSGLTFLRNLMRTSPMPVVMVSAFTEAGARLALDALAAGAVDCIGKPKSSNEQQLEEFTAEFIVKLHHAARVKAPFQIEDPAAAHRVKTRPDRMSQCHSRSIVAIGASTGGTQAIKLILNAMPLNFPAIVISQHIPATFATAFTKRVNDSSLIEVKEAEEGELLLDGHAYLAPGDCHLEIIERGKKFYASLNHSEPVNRFRPSVDVMFQSIAIAAGQHSIAVLLTGMGSDGAQAIGKIQQRGATTIAQDEASSVVWGMPGAAVKMNHIDHVLPLSSIAQRLIEMTSSQTTAKALASGK